MNHRTNLVVQFFLKLTIVRKIEYVLQSLYPYFSHSPKRIQEFAELVDMWKLRDNAFQ
jgi:hypothetical protein